MEQFTCIQKIIYRGYSIYIRLNDISKHKVSLLIQIYRKSNMTIHGSDNISEVLQLRLVRISGNVLVHTYIL